MAASSLNDAVFRLPEKFLTDDDLLFDKENAPVNCKSSGGLETAMTTESLKPSSVTVSFPSEFPYEFDSALSSPVESVVCSTESENSDSSDEEFLAGLTRRLSRSSTQRLAVPGVTQKKLEKSRVMAGSPESTLNGIGSWSVSSNGSPNGSYLVFSPPSTPFGCRNDTWDLISAAAGQVTRLKMSNEALNKHNNNINSHGRGPPKSSHPAHAMKNLNFGGLYPTPTQSINQYHQHVKQEQILRGRQLVRPMWVAQPHQQQQPPQIQNKLLRNVVGYHENTISCCGGGGRPLGLSQSVWPALQVQQQQHTSSSGMRAVFPGGSGGGGVKRHSTGTGVFLPRRYGNNNNNNNPSDSRRNSGCSTVLPPSKAVQALNLNFEDINSPHSHVHAHLQAPQSFNISTGFDDPNYDPLMARRNAVFTLQKPAPALNHELQLPQDWTY